jgi:glycoprotein endo-alpha-1,2-mannosidase
MILTARPPVMRRYLLGLLLLVLVVPANALAGDRVSAFYYPWYGTSSMDGAYQHWSQAGHAPPNDIASAYYPAIGLYSSSDTLVIDAQMSEIHSAGIDEIAVSWWGRGSPEDARMPAIVAAAHADGVLVAAHIEPYQARSVASIADDVAYLTGAYGITTFYVYQALDLPIVDWAEAHPLLHAVPDITVYAQTALAGAAAAGRFDGVYTYDIVTYGGRMFRRLCDEAHAVHLLCAPSVGPGYDARRGSGDPMVKPRRAGRTYDAMWRSAIASRADRVTITSFNEWHEGTQIEPAVRRRRARYRYLSYDGAWGLYGQAAEGAYLERTRYWGDVFRNTSLVQPNTRAS